MKKAISNIGWLESEDEIVYKLMNQYGFKGLEIAPTRFFQDPYTQNYYKLLELEQSIHGWGIDLVSMQSLHYGKSNIRLFGNQEERDALLDYTKKAICFASKLGIKTLVFGSPQLRVKKDLENEYQIAIDFFRELGVFAENNNTKICIEANPKEYGTNFLNTTEEAFALVKEVDSLGFKLHIDLGTIIINSEDLSIFDNAKEYIHHIHISEPFLEPINKNNYKLHNKIKELLLKNGYNHWISIEMKKKSEETNVGNIERSLLYISEIFGG